MRLKVANVPETQKKLLAWLCSAADFDPAGAPLLPASEDLQRFYLDPAPCLVEALRHVVVRFLGEIGGHSAKWGLMQIPVSVFILALAAYNLQALSQSDRPAQEIISWNENLLSLIPPARDLEVIIAYHAVLSHASAQGEVQAAKWQKKLNAGFLERSPLTGLVRLDEHTPIMLGGLAVEMLPGWQPWEQSASSPWIGPEEWLEIVVMLLQDKSLARWLRQTWLQMPETRSSCRNLGLLFEALRRLGGLENILLEFYEAYDYFGRRALATRAKEQHPWPLLLLIARLLEADSNTVGSEAARILNRYGHEYLLKFRPLIEIIIARKGIPAEYRALSRELVYDYLRPLLDYVAEGGRQRLNFGRIRYAGNSG